MYLANLLESQHGDIYTLVLWLNNSMQNQFVKVVVDVYCKWSNRQPRYRAYVNNELFCERTWIWDHVYLEEEFQIQAPPGKYTIRYELLDPEGAGLKTRNMRVQHGPASIINGEVHIHHAS
jgi:hypothetical protein